MATTIIKCAQCEVEFEKENKAINRAERDGKNLFCSKSCASKSLSIRYEEAGITKKSGYIVRMAKKRAKLKGLATDIDASYIDSMYASQDGKCALTGLDIHFKSKDDYEKDPYQVSIDRLDDSKGYLKGNVQLVALCINYMRNTFSCEQVKEVVVRLK